MKKTLFKTVGFCGIAGLMISLYSCKKEQVSPVKAQTAATYSSAMLNTSATEVTNISLQMVNMLLSIQPQGQSGKMEEAEAVCAVRTIDSTSSPHKYTYDFGTSCTNSDGELRAGKVVITYNFDELDASQLKKSGTHVEINFQSFTMDTTVYNGTMIFDNNGIDGSGYMEFAIQNNLTIHRTISNTDMTANANLTIEWIEGEGTGVKTDDKYSYTGSISGTYFDENPYNLSVVKPVIITENPDCSQYPIAGLISGTLSDGTSISIDYGSNECDNLATITKNGDSEVVDLSQQ